jgi:hypothetical protein
MFFSFLKKEIFFVNITLKSNFILHNQYKSLMIKYNYNQENIIIFYDIL